MPSRYQSWRSSARWHSCPSAGGQPCGHQGTRACLGLMASDRTVETIWRRVQLLLYSDECQLEKSFQAQSGSAGGESSSIPDSFSLATQVAEINCLSRGAGLQDSLFITYSQSLTAHPLLLHPLTPPRTEVSIFHPSFTCL